MGQVILSFCGHCGMLLQQGKGLEETPTCDNCGESVDLRSDRIEGIFEAEEAAKLLEL